ncbi:glycoside hydrolase family 43 protein [Lepidopterella palustris CBS 459.81]|uniref:Glycoside hydrolase family 43 protein n=1 Tax=Lepidopterella palustris CBS 459.81 TaxID=1314670 RepID=A0A8E2DZI5_9PEZI|nr:glycoside hydrolase family 43 protein [Lepidopterella palustris CBS 459.81]
MAHNNSVLTITNTSTADPYMIYAHGKFYLTFTSGDRVEIWSADSLTDFGQSPEKYTVWRPPPNTSHTADLWAPELHALDFRWYIYYAAADPAYGNPSHRMYVLGGPPTFTPPTDTAVWSWQFLGRIAGLPEDQWAIDGTVVTLNGQLYFIYSGWPVPNPTGSDLVQELFIMAMASPTRAVGTPVRISTPERAWEFSGDHGINEGPQFLASPSPPLDGSNSSWVGIVYSCAGSWTKEYKMATLQFLGGDPLDPFSWRKSERPLLQAAGKPPWGPGHGSFLEVGGKVLAVFHGTDGEEDGWLGRKARVMRVRFEERGPVMGGEFCGPLVDAGVIVGGNITEWGGVTVGHGCRGHHRHGLRGLLHGVVGKFK